MTTEHVSVPRELASRLQSLRDRWIAIAEDHSFGDQLDGDFDTLLEAINAIKRLSRATPRDELTLIWRDGYPQFPWSEEWFIAETTYGDRVVLKALPKEYSHDFKTVDETYLKKELIKQWMQFPDSEFKEPEQKQSAPRVVTDGLSAWVGDMKTSAGMDYYVCVGFRYRSEYLTPNVYKIRGRAEFDVAEWNHLLGLGPKPDILAFDTEAAAPQAGERG